MVITPTNAESTSWAGVRNVPVMRRRTTAEP